MIRIAPLSCAALALSACASIEQYPAERPVLAPQAYAGDLPESGVAEDWWEGFNDPVLEELVEQGLAANIDIAIARDRLRGAAALLRAERADRLPRVDGAADASIGLGTFDSDAASVGLLGTFDPDISGRLAAEIRAAAADYAQAEYIVADQRRLVAAAIAAQYIEYRRTGAQLELVAQSTELQERTLRIVTLRFEAGLAANLDVRRAAADLAQTRARRGLIEIARAGAANRLAILLGQPPGLFEPPAPIGDSTIPDYAGGPPAGTPVDLLRRRADILAAEAALLRAAADVGIEQADLRPSLTIPASVALGDGSIGGILDEFIASIGAALDLPLFDGGRRRAEVEAAEAEADARFGEYRLTFLEALGEVENSLVALDANGQRIDALSEAIEQSEAALEQSDALYREGLATLFDLLDAQRQLIASRQSLIDSQAALATSFVSFHAAIGSQEEPERPS
ncbi:efflux transporter outer membrane subunit [Alteriqipengyuania lutimaris]|uniref:RND transporter n=1 Tax=Alteriqipengyuania lutimaris TaxID=1538146 RepID=A0A395LK54_9SPHN|nr:efflux transporter outer membrane subunit [Alteriqipengyuania lutimaris]MBB3033850.1 multidrug efflux system outer membrane protein [Alteriqipengyuania lutimaris]RDS77181.1 RND transporter [Alteriqipengyuania lutimaris]